MTGSHSSNPTRRPWKAWRGWTINRASWIAALLVLVGIVAVLSHLSGTSVDYSRYNHEWNGTSLLFGSLDDRGAVMVDSPDQIAYADDGVLFILAPDGEFGEEEASAFRLFLDRGNIVVLVSDREEENQLLSDIGSSIRIRAGNLTSIDRYYDHPSSVLGFPSGDDPLSAGISSIVLNGPSYAEGGAPVFESSLLSWIDTDGDSRMSRGEELRKFTVVAAENRNEGVLYVITDPSVFINGMLAQGESGGNVLLAGRIMTLLPHLYVDQGHSRTAAAPPPIRVVNLVRESTITKMALVTLVFLAVSLFIVYRREES